MTVVIHSDYHYTAVNAQFLCVTSCGSSGNIVGTFMSLSECCVNNNGGAFEVLSDASIPCQSCGLYEGKCSHPLNILEDFTHTHCPCC